MEIAEWRQRLDRLTLPLAAVGLAGVAVVNWLLWQRDKELLARVKEPDPLPPLEQWPRLPQVSVLVAAWNEADFIQRHIQSFLTLRYPDKELVLCAGGDDGTHALARKFAGDCVIILQQLTGEGKQGALARSLPHATGDIIFLTDADCLLNSEGFERLIYPLVGQGENVTTGVFKPFREQMEIEFVRHQWALQLHSQFKFMARYAVGISGCNCALKRYVVEKAWEGEVDVRTGTDYYLALRVQQAGNKICYVPESSVETRFPVTSSAYIRQRTRWLRNLLFWGYRFGDYYHVRHALITAVLGTHLLLPILPILLGRFGLALWSLTWLAFAISRIRHANALRVCRPDDIRVLSSDLCRVMMGDVVAWARLPSDTLRKTGRAQW